MLCCAVNIQLLCRRSIDFPELAIFASRPGAMINLQWLELPIPRTIFHGPKGVRAIELRLYSDHFLSFIRPSIRLSISSLTLSNDNSSKAIEAICPYLGKNVALGRGFKNS